MVQKNKELIKCPTKLNAIIGLVNLLPIDAGNRLKILSAMFRPDEEIPAFNNGEPFSIEDLIGVEIAQHCFRKNDLLHWSIERYRDLIKARMMFGKLAKINREITPKLSQKEFSSNKALQQKVVRAFMEVALKGKSFTNVYLGFDKDGNLKPQYSDLMDIFTENDIRFYRIQRCKACSKFFWAKRIDAKSCGHKLCAETLSGKDYQAKNKDLISARRSKNRFDRQVDEAKKAVKNAQTEIEKESANKRLQSFMSKQARADQKLQTFESKGAKNNGTL
jgi:hypothetical protein